MPSSVAQNTWKASCPSPETVFRQIRKPLSGLLSQPVPFHCPVDLALCFDYFWHWIVLLPSLALGILETPLQHQTCSVLSYLIDLFFSSSSSFLTSFSATLLRCPRPTYPTAPNPFIYYCSQPRLDRLPAFLLLPPLSGPLSSSPIVALFLYRLFFSAFNP